MKTIVLLSCCKTKLSYAAPAEHLYQSAGFKKGLHYAKSLQPDAIYILSAMHHIVPLDKILNPYDVCLNCKSIVEKKAWAEICLKELNAVCDLAVDKFIILAGKEYYSELIKGLSHVELPLEGLPMGKRLQWYDEHASCFSSEKIISGKRKTSKAEILCDNIHDFANSFPRFLYPFDINAIPQNGIYIFFEKGETYKGKDRIVRIGTHTGQDNLPQRLKEHLCTENKDRSIFRKNIGRAILNREKDPFINVWNLDLTAHVNRDKYRGIIDFQKLSEVEKRVTSYMRENLSFIVFPIEKKEERLQYERFLIEGVSGTEKFQPSANWLGNWSPEEKIRESGLWLKQGLAKRTGER